MSQEIQLKRLAKSIEKAYLYWIKDFIFFHRKHSGQWIYPVEMGNDEINLYLSTLATDRMVAESTQNQAFSAILFLFNKILKKDITLDCERAKTPKTLPVVLSQEEIRILFSKIKDPFKLEIAKLMYGTGMRMSEVCRLRKKDFDQMRLQITVRSSKGAKKIMET